MSGLSEDDLVVALISGGGSALLPSPPEGMTLEDEIAVNKALLASGAPISAMNAVRKHLSTIKGRLAAAAHPAKVFSLVVSDIPGDNPAFVASGPTVPDETSRDEALKIIERYRLDLPQAALAHIKSENAHAPQPDDGVFARNEVRVIASAAVSLEAAAREASRHGVEAVILSDSVEGEAREVAHVHAAIAREVAERDRPFKSPWSFCRAAKRPSPSAAPAVKAGATANFFCPSRSISTVMPISTRLPPIRMALTGRKIMPEPLPMAALFHGCKSLARMAWRGSTPMMPGRLSMRLAICSCRGRPEPMSMISELF